MMSSMLPSPEVHMHSSVVWRDSSAVSGVRFGVRRISLAQRTELTRQVRELTIKNEFLKAGTSVEGLDAALGDLLARRIYVEWGLAEIRGLKIDNSDATPQSLIEKGPESLTNEIVQAVFAELHLTEEERKNF